MLVEMELRHLRYFVAVAEEQNVTRAAARLHVAQPALSRQIHDLEDELKVALFERRASSIHLTQSGRIFLKEAQAVLRRADAAVKKIRSLRTVDKSELQVGYSPSPTAAFLHRVLHAYEKTAPHVKVRLHDLSSDEMFARIRTRRLHVALMVEHSASTMNGLGFERLKTYRAGAVVAPDHRFAQHRSLSIAEILGEPLVVFSGAEYSDYHRWLAGVLGTDLRSLNIAQECDGQSSLIAAVEAGAGIAISGEAIMSVVASRLVFVPLQAARKRMNVGALYKRSVLAATPALRDFLDVSKRCVGSR